MRKEEISELLEESDELIRQIISYRKVPRPKVKSILEHLRSSLEYLAQDINEKISRPKKIIYFPYGKTEDDFKNSINKYFPLLSQEFPAIYDEIVKIQKFKLNDDWLLKLCRLTNDAKHKNAIDVKSQEEVLRSTSVEIDLFGSFILAPGSTANVRNVSINGKRLDDFTYRDGNLEITKKGEIPIRFKITKDKKILIGDEYLDLIPFLEKCQSNIKTFIEETYSIIEKN